MSHNAHQGWMSQANTFTLLLPLQDAVVIGARLDFDATGDSCRLAFYGRLLAQLGSGGPQELQRLQVFKVRLHPGCALTHMLACKSTPRHTA